LAHRMGRPELEARSLSELLRQFPDSPYADVARNRLNDDPR
jgi:outer membrane protein assembly factor BamD (BamD/ComL family)